jgi:AraC family transcriptional regulator
MAINSSAHPSPEYSSLPIAPPLCGRRFEHDDFFVELCPRQPYQVRYQPDWHILGVALEAQAGYHSFASDRIASYHAPANTFAFTPARCETFSESNQGGAYLIFALSPKLFETYVDDISAQRAITLRRLSHLRNQHVTAIGRAAQRFLQANLPGGRLYLEALAGQFATHVILALLSKPGVTVQPGKLDALAFNQLLEFVDANLCDDLSLDVLADVIGMSPSQFVRSFKTTVGQTPHAWLITHRVNRAKELLTNTKQSIAHIALDCGFNSQSHMTTLFSKHLGTTPKQYREIVSATKLSLE